ncbi:hypothetical protein BDN71DRAFT_353280 [Pleurotus eryngii]|uniref:Secreted protein n=1 Tax=Pleurotus eryngii TaxID=5323 RepID=A0A9P6A227_PLEER|nr:hypothetical protein BDN71DRAFT_353280 [Pleurotus eryngii]
MLRERKNMLWWGFLTMYFHRLFACSGEDFCYPAGDICYRDTENSPRCRSPSSGRGGGGGGLPQPPRSLHRRQQHEPPRPRPLLQHLHKLLLLPLPKLPPQLPRHLLPLHQRRRDLQLLDFHQILRPPSFHLQRRL